MLLANPDNLARLQRATGALQAEVIAVPPLELGYLERGHAVRAERARDRAYWEPLRRELEALRHASTNTRRR